MTLLQMASTTLREENCQGAKGVGFIWSLEEMDKIVFKTRKAEDQNPKFGEAPTPIHPWDFLPRMLCQITTKG